MKYSVLILALILCVSSFGQQNNHQIETKEEPKEATFEVIEHVPVYQGCGIFSDNKSLKKCMSEKIIALVSKNYDINIAKSLGLPDGIVRVNAIFKINTKGEIVGIRSRAPHPELEKEAIRVISLIPQLEKPGIQRGKPVIVPYSLPIVFKIENEKLSKKELRKLKRRAKKS